MTEHRFVRRAGPLAWGTGGHDHHRRLTIVDGRRVQFWACALAGGGPCPDDEPRPGPEAPPCLYGHSGTFRRTAPSGKSYCSRCVTERSRERRGRAA